MSIRPVESALRPLFDNYERVVIEVDNRGAITFSVACYGPYVLRATKLDVLSLPWCIHVESNNCLEQAIESAIAKLPEEFRK